MLESFIVNENTFPDTLFLQAFFYLASPILIVTNVNAQSSFTNYLMMTHRYKYPCGICDRKHVLYKVCYPITILSVNVNDWFFKVKLIIL